MKKLSLILLFLLCFTTYSQHHSKLVVEVNSEKKVLNVYQELTFYNQSNDTLSSIILNDWNNSYTDKNTPLARRFSDEFIRSFHLASEKERGRTTNLTIIDQNKFILNSIRPENYPDLLEVQLKNKLLPNQKIVLTLSYLVKIPSDKFTGYGYDNDGNMNLKNWFLSPARYENHTFTKYNNVNLDDIANSLTDYELELTVPENYSVFTDLNQEKIEKNIRSFSGINRLDFSLFLETKTSFSSFKNSDLNVYCNLKDNNLDDIQKAISIDKVVNYVSQNIGAYPHQIITVSQADYERNPFYGLNQLPAFISPFQKDFIFELKFLKTYLNNYLKNTLRLDGRKDGWVIDAIQIHTMMKYIDEFYPKEKMMGNVSRIRLLRGYHLVSLDFNEQYSYFYMLMARKNLDQPLGTPKNKLIRFNEKIASKYRAGLSLKYLDSYLANDVIPNSIKYFFKLNKTHQTNRNDFETIIFINSDKNIDWYFKTIIDSRDIIDYKFDKVTKSDDSISFSLTNKTNISVPIPIYGLKNKTIVFKNWIDVVKQDSTYTMNRNGADKIVINYKNEVPEFNLRNNWKSFKPFRISNKPIKFNFLKDLEDPFYNQIIYVPTLEYNLYDGLLFGMRFHNKTILDKPFNIDINPSYSVNTRTISGSASISVNQFNRDSKLYLVKYMMGSSLFHYAPDAYYTRFNPTVYLKFRPDNLRDNRKETIILREVIVNRQKSAFVTDNSEENYSVFNARYINFKTEVTNHFGFLSDMQLANSFGKLATEFEYRKLYDNNRQLNLRLFAGAFLYKKTDSNFFDFGLDRPSDYLFDYKYLGRSESTGLFSQQIIITDGGFKSFLEPRYANQWMVTTNASFSLWNWIEMYGDLGMIKNKFLNQKIVYDSGIRLNLVTDYLELYFPLYSNNGWETAAPNYGQKIRFVFTFSPDTLINLFTRKWF